MDPVFLAWEKMGAIVVRESKERNWEEGKDIVRLREMNISSSHPHCQGLGWRLEFFMVAQGRAFERTGRGFVEKDRHF